jgi:hypothetical protein
MKPTHTTTWSLSIAIVAAVLVSGCASGPSAPTTANVAVSQAAVENATVAGAAEFAPLEMASARDKIIRSQKAMASGDYALANDLATQAQAEAKLAQGKANSAKAKAVADALQTDINVLREELARNAQK